MFIWANNLLVNINDRRSFMFYYKKQYFSKKRFGVIRLPSSVLQPYKTEASVLHLYLLFNELEFFLNIL